MEHVLSLHLLTSQSLELVSCLSSGVCNGLSSTCRTCEFEVCLKLKWVIEKACDFPAVKQVFWQTSAP